MTDVTFTKLWIDYIKKYSDLFDKEDIKIKSTFKKTALFIDSRIDEKIEWVIKNFMYFLHDEWNLTIVYTNHNENYIKNLVKNIGDVKLLKFNIEHFDIQMYNQLLKSEEFYNAFNESHLLIFQIDTLLRKKIPKEYLQYSYVGAPWKSIFPWTKMSGCVGNGGLSLRKKEDMINIIKYSYPILPPNINEDVYFSYGCEYLNLKKPNIEDASRFSVETVFYEDPIGLHKPHFKEEMFIEMLKI